MNKQVQFLKKVIMLLAMLSIVLFLYIIIPTVPLITSSNQEITISVSVHDAEVLQQTLYKELTTKKSITSAEQDRLLIILSQLSETLNSK